MQLISLMTDFGIRDGYDGVMKGVILRIAPGVQIIDISHTIQPQNILEGSLVLDRSYRYFPAGTIHVAVVDPGVGTHRRPIAAQIGEHRFVCPDNGLISLPLNEAEKNGWEVKIVHLDQPRFWLPQISSVFHGRDIFSPVAAYLALGFPLEEVGSLIHDPIRLNIPQPEKIKDGWKGQVVTIDRFGNLGTNLNSTHLEGQVNLRVQVSGRQINGLVETFGSRVAGELIALIGADGELTVSIVNGSAETVLNARRGDPIQVLWDIP